MKPFSEASEQNKEPILAVLRELFAAHRVVLEIGSGTGQHAVHFARHLPHLTWLTSDLPEQHAGIMSWLADAVLPNVMPPLTLDVSQKRWPVAAVDAVFSANTAHIMSAREVGAMFAGVGRILRPGGSFALYGPFNDDGRYTSDSNARFDAWLKQQNPKSGIKDFALLGELAEQAGLEFLRDYPMPVNNRTLAWRRAEK